MLHKVFLNALKILLLNSRAATAASALRLKRAYKKLGQAKPSHLWTRNANCCKPAKVAHLLRS